MGGTRATYVCELDLPSGALINNISLHGLDGSNSGYVEGAVWRTAHNNFGSEYISPTYLGTWQTSGGAAQPGAFSVPVYSAADAPHMVSGSHRYTLGLGIQNPANVGTLFAYGFSVTYTIE